MMLKVPIVKRRSHKAFGSNYFLGKIDPALLIEDRVLSQYLTLNKSLGFTSKLYASEAGLIILASGIAIKSIPSFILPWGQLEFEFTKRLISENIYSVENIATGVKFQIGEKTFKLIKTQLENIVGHEKADGMIFEKT